MCFVSFVGDDFSKQWGQNDWNKQFPQIPHPNIKSNINLDDLLKQTSTQGQIDLLKKQIVELTEEVKIMKRMLEAAKRYDEKNNEPHCEMEDKVKLLKEVAKMVGVDLRDIFPEPIRVVTSGYLQVVPYTIGTILTNTTNIPSGSISNYTVK